MFFFARTHAQAEISFDFAQTSHQIDRLTPGSFAFVSCGSWEMHGDFMTRAWAPDPLKQALAMIPGYPLVRDSGVRAKKGA